MKSNSHSRILVILAFFAVYFIWGTTYLANTFALKGFPPFLLAAFRYLAAATLLAAYATARGLTWPSMRESGPLSISGILMLVGGSGIVVFAQQYINSGYAAAIVATEPLWFIIFDRSRWKLYLSNKWVLAGLAIGFGGIGWFSLLSSSSQGNATTNNHWLGTALLLLSSMLWVMGTLYGNRVKKPSASNLTRSAVQLLAASIVSLALALFRGELANWNISSVTAQGWGGLGYLVVMGSLVAFLAFNWLVKVQPPAVVSTHTFVNPMVALLMGWLIASEQVQYRQLIAFVVVLLGVLIIQLKKPAESSH
ncbi:MAG: EamA family transporter [Pedobacter sp.]|nr:MAG: EamA family transporter [Pedobacter sp.]